MSTFESSGLATAVRARLSSPTTQKVLVNLGVLVVLWIVLSLTAENFLDWTNFTNILRQIAIVAIVASAATLVMVGGGLDLSVGGITALSGVSAALIASHGAATPVAFILGALVGVGVGLVNGLLIVRLGLNPVIATLGTLYVSRGAANVVTDGLPIYDVPPNWSNLGTGFTLGLPTPAIILAIVVVVLWIVQRYTLLGKYTVAVGSNFEAARLAGIRSIASALRSTSSRAPPQGSEASSFRRSSIPGNRRRERGSSSMSSSLRSSAAQASLAARAACLEHSSAR